MSEYKANLKRIQALCDAMINEENPDPSSKDEKALNDLMMQFFPHGTILPFFDTGRNIPAGWVICDGTKDAPDLTNRLIVGALNPSSVGKLSQLHSSTTPSESTVENESVGLLFIMRHRYL